MIRWGGRLGLYVRGTVGAGRVEGLGGWSVGRPAWALSLGGTSVCALVGGYAWFGLSADQIRSEEAGWGGIGRGSCVAGEQGDGRGGSPGAGSELSCGCGNSKLGCGAAGCGGIISNPGGGPRGRATAALCMC